MEIPLNLKRGERQTTFLDYLNSALRSRVGSFQGQAGLNADGLFQISTTGPFPIGQGTAVLTWSLFKSGDGELLRLTVEFAGDGAPPASWEAAAYEFVTSVLANTLAETRTKYFRRSLFYYLGPQLDGEYWLRGFRFAPAYPDDPHPHLINAERIVCMDQEVLAIDDQHASALTQAAARRLSARLSLLLNTGLYGIEHSQRWVLPVKDGVPAAQSERFQLGFYGPSLTATQMPAKGAVCAAGKFQGSLTARYRVAGELLSLPAEARKILRAIDSALPAVTDAFDRGARLYQVGAVCGRQFPSVALAYRVAAVEAISAADQGTKGFSKFMRAHVRSELALDDILNYMHGTARSAHFHAGEFPSGEFDRIDAFMSPLMDADKVQLDSLHRTCYELTREAIVNWLTDNLPDERATTIDDTGAANPGATTANA